MLKDAAQQVGIAVLLLAVAVGQPDCCLGTSNLVCLMSQPPAMSNPPATTA
jgi:hypothetical protein